MGKVISASWMLAARRAPARAWTWKVFAIVLATSLLLAGNASGKPHLLGSPRNLSLYKPPSYCPANHTCLTDAEWLLWERNRAVALATGETSYPLGPEVTEKIRFIFWAPKHVCGGYFFTRVRWRYSGEHDYTMSRLLPPVCIWSGA